MTQVAVLRVRDEPTKLPRGGRCRLARLNGATMALFDRLLVELRNLRRLRLVKAPACCRSYFVVLLPLVLAANVLTVCAAPQTEKLHEKYARLTAEYAEAVPGWRPKTPATGSLLFTAPDQYAPVEPHSLSRIQGDLFRNAADSVAASSPTTATLAHPVTHEGIRALRIARADALFDLARQAADEGQPSLAFEWATEAVRENPDHAEARRVLGYESRDGEWLTAYGARMHDAGKRWHAKFGWLDVGDIARYESGERRVGKRWVTADEDAARRKLLKNGWQVRTDHFLVTTNHSLEAAADLAARLEGLHQVWRQLFAGFYLSESEVKRLFTLERRARRQSRPFRVYYHRDRGEYGTALVRRQPRIAETLGIYFDQDREAHFFAGEDQDAGTLYHEAVHQLFYETRPAAKHVGELANFWVIEGVAAYFETLREHDDPEAGRYFTIGESGAGRLPSARARLLEGGFYVPLDELVRFGKSDLQRHAEIAKLYSQAAGLSAFLMDAENSRFREGLVRYLEAVYAGRDDAASLAGATGRSAAQLDIAYRRYMESLPE